MYENNVKNNTTNKLLMLQQTEAVGVIYKKQKLRNT